MLKEAFQELQAKLLEAVRHHYGPRLVSLVIYGSVARGTQRFDSDLDFLLIAENLPRGRLRRLEDFEKVKRDLLPLLSDLEGRGFRTSFSPVFKTPQEVLRGSPLFFGHVRGGHHPVGQGRLLQAGFESVEGSASCFRGEAHPAGKRVVLGSETGFSGR